jgi:hypothetical protein
LAVVMEALRTALAEPQAKPRSDYRDWDYQDDLDKLEAEPEQEPVCSNTYGCECSKHYTHPPRREQPEQVHQWREVGCVNWYDGHPDHEDGGGPYEARILYTHPVDDTALLRQALGALEYFLTYSEGKRDEETALAAITALKERLGEKV